jgi:hypothetical protein
MNACPDVRPMGRSSLTEYEEFRVILVLKEAIGRAAGLMQNLHVIHDDIALHKSPPVTYIDFKKTGRDQRKRSGPSAARPAASA